MNKSSDKIESNITLSKHLVHKILISNPDLIVYCKADGNYTQIHLSKRRFIVSKTLKKIQSLLPKGKFIRVHRSYLVNIDYIADITCNNSILLKSGITLSISRRMMHSVYMKLSNLLLDR